MDKVATFYATGAVKIISKGYVTGGLAKLKREFPEAYRDMEIKLERNWNERGVNNYVKDVIGGLKAVGKWNG